MWALEYGLQLAIQVVIDVGHHILASLGEHDIGSYVEVALKLGEHGILPLEFSENIKGRVGLRNILVHENVDVDVSQLYSILQGRPGDFRKFAHYSEKYRNKA